jgi:hypothetical protein
LFNGLAKKVGKVRFSGDNSLGLALVFNGLTQSEAEAVFKPFFDFRHGQPESFAIAEPLRVSVRPAQHWWDAAYTSGPAR